MEKIRINEAVIVEGKYDKITLEAVLDALIIPTNGFGIFSDKEQRAFIKALAQQRGLIVVTDSDCAGFRIRAHLAGLVPPETIKHVFIPDVFGKEGRKKTRSKEGKLGVEGMSADTLRRAFALAGIDTGERPQAEKLITRLDLYEDGFSGGENSSTLRFALYDELGLPRRLSTSACLDILNRMLSYDEYKALAEKVRQEQ